MVETYTDSSYIALRNQEGAQLSIVSSILVFFDVLGYKEKMKKMGQMNFMKNIYLTFKIFLKSILKFKFPMDNHSFLFNNFKFKYKIFSDNVLISIEMSKNPLDNMNKIIALLNTLCMIQTFFLNHDMVVRGAVHLGDLCNTNDLLFGNGLISAVEYEKKAKYPRIIISNELFNYIEVATNIMNYEEKCNRVFNLYSSKTVEDVLNWLNAVKIPESYIDDVEKIKNEFSSYDKSKKIKGCKHNSLVFINLILNQFFGQIKESRENIFQLLVLDKDDCYFLNYLLHEFLVEKDAPYMSLTNDIIEIHYRLIKKNIEEYKNNNEILEKYIWLQDYHETAVAYFKERGWQ
jgi:hypothetical protein